jgi:DNA-binding NarL/FixJ family response regulator
LAGRRIGDLQTLRYERYPSGKMDDHRDRWLLLMSVKMLHITHPAVLEDEIRKLSREIGYPEQTARSNMAQVVERAYRAARHEKVAWMGRKVDPRYGYKNETIIELLEITDEEQKNMKTLFGPAEKRRRDRERKRRQRREEGVKDRSATAEARRVEVGRRTAAGESVTKIAEVLGVSKDRVKQIRRTLKREDVPSVH